jgi:hypothetical protein
MTRTCPQQLSRCEMSYRRLPGYLVLLVLIPPQLPTRRQGQTLPITPLRALHQHTSDTEMLRPSQCTVVHITVALYISTMPIYKHTMLTQHQFSLYTAQCSASYIYSRHLPLTVSTLNSVYSTRSIRHVRPNGNHGHWAHRATEHRSRRSRSILHTRPKTTRQAVLWFLDHYYLIRKHLNACLTTFDYYPEAVVITRPNAATLRLPTYNPLEAAQNSLATHHSGMVECLKIASDAPSYRFGLPNEEWNKFREVRNHFSHEYPTVKG